MQKKKKREKEREREKEEEEEMENQAHGLPTSHHGWEASTMVNNFYFILFEGVLDFAWKCS